MNEIKSYNIKEKKYYDGKKQVVIYKDNVIMKGQECYNSSYKFLKDQLIDGDICIDEFAYRNKVNFKRSQRATLSKVYDISRCNYWDWFVTFTFAPNKVDRYDYDKVSKKLKNWIDRVRRTSPYLKYLIVPELHKDGAYHFHGLFANCEFEFVDSGKKDKTGNKIYNINSYKLGFTTATKIKNNDAVNKYIAKYLTKELFSNTKHRKRYWVSRNVDLPEVNETFNQDVSSEIKKLENSSRLLSRKVKKYTYTDDMGVDFVNEVYYFELDS